MPNNDDFDDDDPIGLMIPIGILLILLVWLQIVWLLIPIAVLLIVFVSSIAEGRKIKERQYWTSPGSDDYQSTKPIEEKSVYDRKKQKDEGITCGTFIPIIIIGWLLLETLSWVFLIPLFFLVFSLIKRILDGMSGRAKVREEIEQGKLGSVHDMSSHIGMPEDRVRRHIIDEKRSGSSDLWFDSTTGQATGKPIVTEEPTSTSIIGCTYCGFALKDADRFCPYCGAPIRA
ncbi:MAG: zinc ribbon domain-containing protein [Candidatus Thorarchaeota archaeon]